MTQSQNELEPGEAFASGKLAHLVRMLSTGPDNPTPPDGYLVREHGDELHWFALSIGPDTDGLRPIMLSFGTQTGFGVNMTTYGELRAWWNPSLPEPAGLSAVESVALAPPPVSLAAFVDEAMRYVLMDLPPWHGPLCEALMAKAGQN
ncbi:hypothetical protein SAMN07250955_11016 [Arboricoccus pini]|uniref:Uncharacterized protein n=1 Tax=Arboricoccus pini TaxID=1963835 RepID=A0A212RK96_9PROT|nr:hypothetical protein [Arboricoccus pini]SNB72878.1 hypothetical protein SAMN07250955_11016 [Arboricoccus pini]